MSILWLMTWLQGHQSRGPCYSRKNMTIWGTWSCGTCIVGGGNWRSHSSSHQPVTQRRAPCTAPSVCTCVCVCVCELSSVQLFVILQTVARQSPLSTGFSRQEYWSGFPFLPLGDLTHPGIEPASPELASVFLTIEPPAKPCSALWGEAKPSTWAGISCERLRAYFEQVRTSDYDS